MSAMNTVVLATVQAGALPSEQSFEVGDRLGDLSGHPVDEGAVTQADLPAARQSPARTIGV